MSSDCRQLLTRKFTRTHKLLIGKVGATVAEGRQALSRATPRNNKRKRHKVQVHCERCAKITKFFAQLNVALGTKTSVISCYLGT